MENAEDFWKNIKDRLSNPLLFSFLISWLVCNWRITVALIWYDSSQIKAEGYKSLFEFIEEEFKSHGSFLIPALLAIAYTFIMPYLKLGIKIFNSYVLKWGEEKEFKVLNIQSPQLIDLQNTLQKEKDKNLKLHDKVNAMSNTSILNGYWTYSYKDEIIENGMLTALEGKYDVFISDGYYYEIINDKRNKKFVLAEFNFNVQNKSMLFIKRKLRDNYDIPTKFIEENVINVLRVDDNYASILIGYENERKVEYRRIDKF